MVLTGIPATSPRAGASRILARVQRGRGSVRGAVTCSNTPSPSGGRCANYAFVHTNACAQITRSMHYAMQTNRPYSGDPPLAHTTACLVLAQANSNPIGSPDLGKALRAAWGPCFPLDLGVLPTLTLEQVSITARDVSVLTLVLPQPCMYVPAPLVPQSIATSEHGPPFCGAGVGTPC